MDFLQTILCTGKMVIFNMLKVILIILLILASGLISFGVHAVMTAPVMPESWDEETGIYARCVDCSWTDESRSNEKPGPGCRICPFCYTPVDSKN